MPTLFMIPRHRHHDLTASLRNVNTTICSTYMQNRTICATLRRKPSARHLWSKVRRSARTTTGRVFAAVSGFTSRRNAQIVRDSKPKEETLPWTIKRLKRFEWRSPVFRPRIDCSALPEHVDLHGSPPKVFAGLLLTEHRAIRTRQTLLSANCSIENLHETKLDAIYKYTSI